MPMSRRARAGTVITLELVTPEYAGLPVRREFSLAEASSAGTKGLNGKTLAATHPRLPSRATKQPA
jgi:hypothetical protein